jgi:hypothetical protein
MGKPSHMTCDEQGAHRSSRDVQTSNLDKREELIAKMWRHQDESLKILSALESKLFGADTEEGRIESKAAAKTCAASVTATEC